MSLTFEKVNGILTDGAREKMMSDIDSYRKHVKEYVMELLYTAQPYGHDNDIRIFDAIADIGSALNSMVDIMDDYDAAYFELLGKYSENIQRLAELE